MQMSALLTKMLLFVVMIAIGWTGARKKVFTSEFCRGVSWVLLNVFLTASILNSITSMDVSSYSLRKIGLAILMSSIVMLVLYLIPGILVRILPVDRKKAPQLELLMSIVNNMFVALPVAETFYGSEAVFTVAVSGIAFNALAFAYGLPRMRGQKGSVKLKSLVNIPLIATLVATLVFSLHISVPAPLRSLCSSVSGGTVPISMLLVGATIGNVSLSKTTRDRSMYLLAFVRFLLMPFVTWLLLKPFSLEPPLANTLIIMAASPSAIIVTAFDVQSGGNGEYTSEGILFTTLLSIITLPITAYLIV